MAHSPSREGFTPDEERTLIDIASRSILAGLDGGPALEPDLSPLPERLRRPQGAFVTLRVHGRLNGCVGSLAAERPLAATVARVAWEAAFADTRLPQLHREDLEGLHVEISALSDLEPMAVSSEAEFLAAVRPGVDGILLEAGWARATLLPAVWREYPDPAVFLHALQRKAGLVPGRWPPETRVSRYTVVEFDADLPR